MDANNNYFGIKVSQQGVNVNNANPNQLIYQNDYNTQTFFMNSGTGSTGKLNFGQNPDGTYGMSVVNSGGQTLFELNGETFFWYDNLGNNIMQVGLLPDGTYGWAVATPGNSVADAY